MRKRPRLRVKWRERPWLRVEAARLTRARQRPRLRKHKADRARLRLKLRGARWRMLEAHLKRQELLRLRPRLPEERARVRLRKRRARLRGRPSWLRVGAPLMLPRSLARLP